MKSDIYFEYIEDLADYVVDKLEEDEDLYITVIGKFAEMKIILREFMMYEFVNYESLNIESPIVGNYSDEFVLSLWLNDGILEIGCEKLKNKKGAYTSPCGDIVFLFDNCSSKIIPLCEGSQIYYVGIDEECDCDEDCDECCPCECHDNDVYVECSTDEDGDPYGFVANRSDSNGNYSFSYYTNGKLTEENICDILEEFGF